MASDHEHHHHHNHHRKVTVFGGGTFATAVGTLFARNNFQVVLLVRDPAVIKSINHEHKNVRYMPEYTLLPNITATDDPHAALDKAEFIVHAVPVQASPAFLEGVAPFVPKGVPLISLSKGIHLETLKFMCDIFQDALGPEQPTAYLSGPSFARELMDEQPTGLVAASANHDIAVKLQHALSSARVRVYTSTAVLAVELGGALKNIYAIASGVSEGMGFRLNAAALLITRACSEIRKLAAAMDADAATINGLAGMGDLMLTCFGPASRNRTVGVRLGKGEKLQAILGSMAEVAEGVPTAGAVIKLADKFNLDLPLARGVAEILEGADPHPVLDRLMKLPLRPED